MKIGARFGLKNIHRPYLLLISMIILGSTFIYDILNIPGSTTKFQLVLYAIAILIAMLWSIINYVDHIKINPLYRKPESLTDFINNLTSMSADEKIELQNYMEDYMKEKVKNGDSTEEATRQVIAEFQVQEIVSSSDKAAPFTLKEHRYLITLGSFLIAFGVAALLLNQFIPNMVFLVLELLGICYGVGMLMTYLTYGLLNKILSQKSS